MSRIETDKEFRLRLMKDFRVPSTLRDEELDSFAEVFLECRRSVDEPEESDAELAARLGAELKDFGTTILPALDWRMDPMAMPAVRLTDYASKAQPIHPRCRTVGPTVKANNPAPDTLRSRLAAALGYASDVTDDQLVATAKKAYEREGQEKAAEQLADLRRRYEALCRSNRTMENDIGIARGLIADERQLSGRLARELEQLRRAKR